MCLAAGAFHLQAQNETDVLRYGWLDPLSSTRVTAMGGSFGALGADLSCMGINPAGLGMYRRGDLVMNAGVHSASTTSLWGTRQVDAARADVVASNFGVALTYPSVDADWPFFTLAVAHQNRALHPASEHRRSDHRCLCLGPVCVASAGRCRDLRLRQHRRSPERLPSSTATVHPWPGAQACCSLTTPTSTPPLWKGRERGPTHRTGRPVGGDPNRVWHHVPRPHIHWRHPSACPKVLRRINPVHTEASVAADADLRDWRYEESLSHQGRGMLLRFGVLARVSDVLRVGLAHQTRGRLTLLDTYATAIRTSWLDATEEAATSPTSNSEYLMLTPDRSTVSASVLMGKLGVLNADYVRSDMRRGELRDSGGFLSSGYDFGAENAAVDSGYRVVHQARVGLELRVGDDNQFRIRGGGGMATSPFVGDAVQSDANRYHVSVGGGYRIGNVHFGVAWRTAWHSEDYYFMGAFSPEPAGQLQRRASSLLLSAGLRL